MKLESVRLRNFRAYVDATFRVDDLTALVGRNDAGKSSVLEALAIFFESDGAKIDLLDRNKFTLENAVEIRCTFSDLPDPLIIDDAAPTSLAQEFLLNSEGKLEIVKRWRFAAKIQSEVCAHALHPTDTGINDLLEMKIEQLKARVEERNLEVADKRKAPLLRQALLASVENKTLAAREVSLSGDGDGKKIWQRLEKELPLYVLFRADRSTSDEDAEAQDPMKLAVREALKQVESELQRISEHVKQRVQDVAIRTVEELKKIDHALGAELRPTFKVEPKWDTLFKLSLSGDNEIPLNKRGSGVRRLVLLSFLLSEIERRRVEESRVGVIIAVEEPETALHPTQQTLLVKTLARIAGEANTQVMLTTHAPALSALLPHRSLRLVKRAGPDAIAEVEDESDTPSHIASELGVFAHPDRREVRVAVCVEGPTDAQFLARASTLLREVDATLPDLSGADRRILLLPLGGGTLTHWVENHYLRHLKVREVHIYDRDVTEPPHYQGSVDKVNGRGDGSRAFLTQKRELENYYPVHCIEAILEVPVERAVLSDTCDVCMVVAAPRYEMKNPGQTWASASAKLRRNCADRVKKLLADRIPLAVTAADLQATGFLDELKVWMQPVIEALNVEVAP